MKTNTFVLFDQTVCKQRYGDAKTGQEKHSRQEHADCSKLWGGGLLSKPSTNIIINPSYVKSVVLWYNYIITVPSMNIPTQ